MPNIALRYTSTTLIYKPLLCTLLLQDAETGRQAIFQFLNIHTYLYRSLKKPKQKTTNKSLHFLSSFDREKWDDYICHQLTYSEKSATFTVKELSQRSLVKQFLLSYTCINSEQILQALASSLQPLNRGSKLAVLGIQEEIPYCEG